MDMMITTRWWPQDRSMSHSSRWNTLHTSHMNPRQVEDVSSRNVFPGAQVRVHSLQSALGAKLNGCEGVVESWNAATCRWQVRISDVGVKAIRDENLEPLNPGVKGSGNEHGTSDTIAIYRLLCQDGVTAVHEADFQAVVQRLLPQSQEQMKKLLSNCLCPAALFVSLVICTRYDHDMIYLYENMFNAHQAHRAK